MKPLDFVNWLEKFSDTIEYGNGLSPKQWLTVQNHLAPTIASTKQPIGSVTHDVKIPSENPDRIISEDERVAVLGGARE